VKGEASVAAQGDFLIQLHNWVDSTGVITFLFEAFDEPWKGGGENSPPNEIEKHWGVFYEDRTPKESFRGYVSYRRMDQE
jgi:exo-beta-1,3-glucanase (GH17 family)